jgi:hypothetical protein
MKYFLVALLLFICQNVYAQVSKDTYEQAVNYLNYKTIEQTIENKEKLKEFKLNCDCTEYNHITYDKIVSSIPFKYAKSKELAVEIESLKSDYSIAKNNPVQYLTSDIFKDDKRYQRLSKFKTKREGEIFNDFQIDLKEGIGYIFGKNNQAYESEVVSNDKLNSEVSEPTLEPSEKAKAGWFVFELDVISIFFTLITLFILIAYFNFNKENGTVSKEIEDYISRKLSNKLFNGSNDLTHLASREELSRLRSDIETLKDQIYALKAKQVNDSTSSSNHIKVGDIIPLTKIEEKPNNFEKLTFYLSSPNVDESFNSTSISNVFKNGASIYKFTKLNEQYADFEIDSREDAIKLALGFPDKNIDPACDAQNAFNPRAKSVYTSKPGRAELLGDKWKIRSKAKIQYV